SYFRQSIRSFSQIIEHSHIHHLVSMVSLLVSNIRVRLLQGNEDGDVSPAFGERTESLAYHRPKSSAAIGHPHGMPWSPRRRQQVADLDWRVTRIHFATDLADESDGQTHLLRGLATKNDSRSKFSTTRNDSRHPFVIRLLAFG